MIDSKKITDFLKKYIVTILFLVLSLTFIVLGDLDMTSVARDLVKRLSRNAFIVLSLIIPIVAGMGINFAITIGAMAAQIGTMMVNEEIAALEIMDISPVRFLVMPRLAAMMLTVPLLSFYTCMVGVVGGGLVSYTQLSVPWAVYWQNAMDFANMKALYVGLFKALLFGFTIVTVSCYEGFRTRNGAVGVGQATRQSVDTNFLVILVIGYFVTRLFY